MYDNTMYHRTSLLIGERGIEKLKNSHIWIFGVGGVGSYAGEALVRAGVGRLTVVDYDVVSVSNLNRQLIALRSTVGRPKTEVFVQRALDINPDINIIGINKCYTIDNSGEFDFDDADYIIDAIDMVTSKLELICKAKKSGVPIVSSMGTGNKLDNRHFEVTDIYKTTTDPLAKVMRRELKKRGVESLDVVYSAAPPVKPPCEEGQRPITASVPWVPSVGGLVIAGKVIEDILRGVN